MNRIHIYRKLFLCLSFVFILAACNSTEPANNAPAAPAVEVQETGTKATAAVGSCSLEGLSETTTDEEAIHALLAAEGQMLVVQDIDRLMRLWSTGSQITDAKNTPDVGEDDQLWIDKDAIRHRYVRVVFPGAPTTVQPADLDIELEGDQATVRSTTQIDNEVSPSGDRWDLMKADGCWLIKGLTYNLEATGQ